MVKPELINVSAEPWAIAWVIRWNDSSTVPPNSRDWSRASCHKALICPISRPTPRARDRVVAAWSAVSSMMPPVASRMAVIIRLASRPTLSAVRRNWPSTWREEAISLNLAKARPAAARGMVTPVVNDWPAWEMDRPAACID